MIKCKFKIGDKVRIKERLFFKSKKVYTIINIYINKHACIYGMGGLFALYREKELVPVYKTVGYSYKGKFKAGDKVICIGDKKYPEVTAVTMTDIIISECNIRLFTNYSKHRSFQSDELLHYSEDNMAIMNKKVEQLKDDIENKRKLKKQQIKEEEMLKKQIANFKKASYLNINY